MKEAAPRKDRGAASCFSSAREHVDAWVDTMATSHPILTLVTS